MTENNFRRRLSNEQNQTTGSMMINNEKGEWSGSILIKLREIFFNNAIWIFRTNFHLSRDGFY